MMFTNLKRTTIGATAHTAVVAILLLTIPTTTYAYHDKIDPNLETEFLSDPVFGDEFDPKKVRFEEIKTSELLPVCKRILADLKPLPKSMTLYAQYINGANRIYIVGKDENQKILVIRGKKCNGDIPEILIEHPHRKSTDGDDYPQLNDNELDGLLKDTLVRHARAFGSKDAFIAWHDRDGTDARSACIAAGNPDWLCRPNKLQKIFDEYRKAAPNESNAPASK